VNRQAFWKKSGRTNMKEQNGRTTPHTHRGRLIFTAAVTVKIRANAPVA
jgi:hypothetical protein